jgi:hypothetical protein
MGFNQFRDIIIYYDGNVLINEKVYPYNEYTLTELIESAKGFTNSKNSKFQIWVWDMNPDFIKEEILLRFDNVKSLNKQKNGRQYFITDNFVFTSFKVIITQGIDFVKSGKEPLEILKELVIDYRKSFRRVNYYANTHTAYCIKWAQKEFGYNAIKADLKRETIENSRCPGIETKLLETLVYGNKAGVTWHNSTHEEKFLEHVYSYDAKSAYPSMCFYPDFPLGKLQNYKPLAENLYTCFSRGYWFAAEFVSEEIIELPGQTFRPYYKNKEPHRFKDGYHYTVTPYDYLNLIQHFNYNPVEDKRLKMTRLCGTHEVGYLNKEYLDYWYKLYQAKSKATGIQKLKCKGALNYQIGKGHTPSIIGKTAKERCHWYTNNYMCPQFAQHIVAHQRYTITRLACKLGIENVLSLSTDCIKSLDPRLETIIEEFNYEQAKRMFDLGYTDTDLGQWEQDNYRWLVFFRDRVYIGEHYDGTVSVALSSYKVPADLDITELFESNRLERAMNDCADLWTSTEKRLKAKEDYNGFKLEKHV